MIITKVLGGLGNQMFQYAAGRAMSLGQGTPLLLDISNFSGYGLHQGFEIQRIFNCKVEIANERDLRRILGWQSSPGIRRVMSRSDMAVLRKKSLVIEPHYHYWDGLKNITEDSYIVGYWQSEKYFQDFASVIRSDFSYKIEFASTNEDIAAQIDQVNAVSLHVRRGDYAKDPVTNATHGLCSLNYYQTAIQYVAARVEQPKFFIFSDDIDWVKTNLKLDYPCRYIDHNQGIDSYNDMRLMSLCQHHIIANSSFSWWGAWLNSSPRKIVFAPKKWFANKNIIKDLFPQEWVTF